MTFDVVESSRAKGRPYELYLFSFGFAPEDRYCYTDSEVRQVFAGDAYLPVAIDREEIVTNGTLDRSALSIRMSHVQSLAEAYRVFPPSYVMSLVIYGSHIGDGDREVLAIWAGRVLNCFKQGSEVTFTAEPISTILRRPGLRRNYQRGCPHALYGPQCKAIKKDFVKTVTEVFVRNIITVSPFTEDPLQFAGGYVEWVSAKGRREIYTIASATSEGHLQLYGTPKELGVGSVVKLFRGCDHTVGQYGCGMHQNILNYGGQLWIPLSNPVNSISTFA